MPAVKTLPKTDGVYTLDYFGDEVLTAFSGREFPNSSRGDFLSALGIPPDEIRTLKQVHSANIVMVRSGEKSDIPQADGMICPVPGIPLGILTADCVPLFFWDPEKKVIAIAHAGWKGIYQGIAGKMVQAYRQNFRSKASSLRVVFGPAIRQCCYEVGEEFQEMFPRFYLKGHVDLIAAVRSQLGEEGVGESNISDTGWCTSCANDRFFSARRDRSAPERILSVIQLRVL